MRRCDCKNQTATGLLAKPLPFSRATLAYQVRGILNGAQKDVTIAVERKHAA